MRLFGAAVILAWLVWLMAGCGSAVARPGDGLVLVDAASGTHYSVGVASGALTLSDVGSSGTAQDAAALTDGATGTGYELGVSSGALTLEPGGSAGANQIELLDAVNQQTCALAIADGALVLHEGAAE